MQFLIPRLILIAMGLSVVNFAACGSDPQQQASSQAPEVATETIAEHMNEHFIQAKQIEAAIIRGELQDSKAAAQWMAEHQPVEGLPQGWEPYVAAMQGAAQAVVEAQNIETAAANLAAMAKACGDCHAAMGAQIQPAPATPPPADTGTVSHMIAHLWAAERMWEGLTTPSDEAWVNGVEMLASAPLHTDDLTEHAEMRGDLETMEHRVHNLATQGREIVGLDARAELYGRFLATCGSCHQTLGQGGPQ